MGFNFSKPTEIKSEPTTEQLLKGILHGDEEHREWLTEAVNNWAENKPIPEPRGSGTKDRLYQEIERLKEENNELKLAMQFIEDNNYTIQFMMYTGLLKPSEDNLDTQDDDIIFIDSD